MDILLREYGRVIWQKRWAALMVFIGITGGIGLDILAPLIYKNIANGLAQPFSPEIRAMLIENLMWLGAMPAEEPYASFSLIASAYWFAYFLVILPLLGVIEKPLPQPETIEADFDAHYGKSDKATPAE